MKISIKEQYLKKGGNMKKYLIIPLLLLIFTLSSCAGPMGIKGETGDKGIKGDTGAPGETGKTGMDGEKGSDGENGLSGKEIVFTFTSKGIEYAYENSDEYTLLLSYEEIFTKS